MADAVVSIVAEQIIGVIAEQAQYHINLVRGAEKEILQLADELNTIRYVLDDAENQRFNNEMINRWLWRLEQTSREMEDVLDEWNYAILKLRMEEHRSDDPGVAPPKKKLVSSFIPLSSCLCFKKVIVRHDIAKKILNVKANLDQVLNEKDRYNFARSQSTTETSLRSWRHPSTSFTDLVKVQGRDSDRDILVTKIMGRQEELGSIQVVSIVGVGGLGKTTLAQLVYGDSRVDKSFDIKIWVCVSNAFNLAAIAKGIIESVNNGDSPSTSNLETLLRSVRDSITGKKFLLVLDDVWEDNSTKWDPLKTSLKCGGAGSKILVTTRNEKVAKIAGTTDNDIHRPRELSHEDCWLLLRSIALFGRNNVKFEVIGKKIALKCNGLPLAAKTLGSLLRFKNTLEEWKIVLESEIWQLKDAKIELYSHLLLSYNELSPTLKRCFSYCGVFPKDFQINVESLIKNWMALGYLGSDIDHMELKGQECFDILAMCSLFQDFKKDEFDEKIISCKMHDIVHGFAQLIRESGKVEVVMNKTSCQACDSLLVSTVNEFCSLFVRYGESPPNLCYCLKRLRVLILRADGLESIPQGLENMIHLRRLNLDGIKQLSLEALQIIFQLYNLQTLCLSDCNLEEIPMEVRNLIHLRHLDLSSNESLKELPREIGDLTQLRHVNLSSNYSLKELPREIENLIKLRHLDLSSNYSLKELPRNIGSLIELTHLYMLNSSLEEMPREIGNLIQLTHLSLRCNISLKKLPMEISNLIQLTHLDLFNVSLEELPREIENLIELTHLDFKGNDSLEELPKEIGKLIQLRYLNLGLNRYLKKLPREIGNLIHLKHLCLCNNESLKKLPNEIGNLICLRHIDLSWNVSLEELPESICSLHKLQTLDVSYCKKLHKIPEGVGQLTSLRTLGEFHGGSGWNKLGLLKKLNHLSGSLMVEIRLDDDTNSEEMVKDAEEAELRNKIDIQTIIIRFEDEMDENEESSLVRMNVMDALQPPPNLRSLKIKYYKGPNLPLSWMLSSLNQLRQIALEDCNQLSSLPPLGKLPCLEEITMSNIKGLQFVGREFLGLTTTIGGGDMESIIVFPKLKQLKFYGCFSWKEWEDITIEEEEGMMLMPCLTELEVLYCRGLTGLPHGLLRKASSLKLLDIHGSQLLEQRYRNKDGLDWKYICQYNPCLQLN